MELIPVEGDAADPSNDRITLTERAKALARVRTTEVGRLGSGRTERRLLGRVEYDETSLRTVTAWIGGRIDRLFVSTTGERVRRGQVIATLLCDSGRSYMSKLFNAEWLAAHELVPDNPIESVLE